MKNVKLLVLTVMTTVMLCGSNLCAQEQLSVIVSLSVHRSELTIETVNPDYGVDKKVSSDKKDTALIVLKKELDKWINQGFQIIESNSVPYAPNWYIITYFLVKEEYIKKEEN